MDPTKLKQPSNKEIRNNILNEDNNLENKLIELKKTPNLILTDQVINDESCKQIANFMKKDDILINLESRDSYITSKGLAFLAEVIKKSRNLKKISFPNNQISENFEDFKEFIKALIVNKSVTELDISGNSLTDTSTILLSELLIQNHYLEILNLRTNLINSEGAMKLLNALKFNQTIQFLELEGNNINSEILFKIEFILKQNRERISFKTNSNKFKLYTPKKDLLHSNSIYTKRDSEKNIDYSKLESMYYELKRKYEEDKINLDLCKNGYVRTIEIEKEKRYKVEEELNLLRSIMEENSENYKTEIHGLKIEAEQEKAKFQLEINCANENIAKLNELNNIIANSNNELKNNLIMINEERDSIINEYEDRIRIINFETKSILEEKDENLAHLKNQNNDVTIKFNQLKINLQNSENQWNEALKEARLKLENEKKNAERIQIEFDSYLEKSKISKANLKAELNKDKELNYKLIEQIELMKLDLENKNNEIVNINNNYEAEIKSLIEENNTLKTQYETKLKEYSSKIYEIEQEELKLKTNYKAEKAHLIANERLKQVKIEEECSMKINEIETKFLILHKEKDTLELAYEKCQNELNNYKISNENNFKIFREKLTKKFQEEKNTMMKYWENKTIEQENFKENISKKNYEYIEEIKINELKLAQMNKSINELISLKENCKSLEFSFDELKSINENLNLISQEKDKRICYLEEIQSKITSERDNLIGKLSSFETINEDIIPLKNQILQLEQVFQQERNRSIFLDVELEKEKIRNQQLIKELETFRKQYVTTRSSPMPLSLMKNSFGSQSSTTFLKKTIIVPSDLSSSNEFTQSSYK